MSTAFAYDPVRRPLPAASLPAPLRPVEAPAAAPAAQPIAVPGRRLAVGAVAITGITAVLVGQLLISIGTADGAYRLAALRAESTDVGRQQQVAAERLRADSAPERLAARAVALGLVADDSPAYLDARTGRVLGSAQPAAGSAKAPGGLTH